MKLIRIMNAFLADLDTLSFGSPVACVYNPLDYARDPHVQYLKAYGVEPRETLLLGMNPGPWGMAQTGVPFGDVVSVREWLGLEAPVRSPDCVHPKRPVTGFSCRRREASGKRLWEWAQDTFSTPRRFFTDFFVTNYCPLLFFEENGQNLTPDKLPAAQRDPLLAVCDRALLKTVDALRVRRVIGIGAFAERQAREVLRDTGVTIGRILHPSPANPAANRGWASQASRQLRDQGVRLPSAVSA